MTERVNREQAATIAALVRTIRPSWDELAIINALGQVKDRDLDEVTTAAINAAKDHTLRAPISITFDGPHWPRTINDTGMWREPNCYTCGKGRTQCRNRRDFEIRRGIPDPHEFETLEDADRNTAHSQIGVKA
jgi:hypothetical protein